MPVVTSPPQAAKKLGSGETAVVATDARDHRQVAEVFLDLRGADFEFTGSSDVDNPDVPNMVDNGLSEWFHGHGLWANGSLEVPTLVGEVDIESLPREPIRLTNDRPWVRFPAAEILDVYSVDVETFPSQEIGFCREMVHDRFDQLDLVLDRDFSEPPGPRMSQQRRVVGTAPGGWPILLDTNTSAVDFVTTQRTAGSVPPQP